jgi:hypothetical protein
MPGAFIFSTATALSLFNAAMGQIPITNLSHVLMWLWAALYNKKRISTWNSTVYEQCRTLTHRGLAEGVGFEPTVGLHPRRFSRPLP